MVTALISLALDKPVLPDVAMTGEVSLSGLVLPVGGIKEKTIAARRSSCKILIFPDGNRRDVDELPAYLKEGISINFAKTYEDVYKIAFGTSEPEPHPTPKTMANLETQMELESTGGMTIGVGA